MRIDRPHPGDVPPGDLDAFGFARPQFPRYSGMEKQASFLITGQFHPVPTCGNGADRLNRFHHLSLYPTGYVHHRPRGRQVLGYALDESVDHGFQQASGGYPEDQVALSD